MSSLGWWDIFKFSLKALDYKFQQLRQTTNVFATVKTFYGPVKGVKRLTIFNEEFYSFERIPFAKPPLGDLRFRAPVTPEPWENVLDCTGPAETPLQASAYFKKFKGSEDCLYLNVFTNNLTPDAPRPVMVWIYGGGFQIGEATRDLYSPDYFMSKDVVLVTIAYRLGPFGFLSVQDPEVNVPGNAGIKDQILALKWVRENIASFGGDVNNVTLFGESAGGTSTHLCMLSEQSKGLIHKAIVMSGSALCPWGLPPKNDWAFRLAQSMGYTGDNNDKEVYAFITDAKGPDITAAATKILNKTEKHERILFAFGPVVEPYKTEQCILPEPPYALLEKTWSNEIPLILGGTSFEGLLFFPEVTRRPATLDEVTTCDNLLPSDLDVSPQEREALREKLKLTYFGEAGCSHNTKMEFLDLHSYREFWHPIYRTALARLRSNAAPTYLYRFDFDSKDYNAIRILLCGREIRGVCHGDELGYMFRAMFTNRPIKGTPEYQCTQTLIDVWTSFATKGDPNCDILEDVKFQPITNDGNAMKCLNISHKTEFKELPELEKLKLWSSFYPQTKL